MVKIIWAPASRRDIESIAKFIALDSEKAACNMVELFFEKAKILERYPLYGKPVRETKSPFLREILVSRYRIIYEVFSEDEVNILTIHHQSRLLKNNPVFRKRLR
jgi:toxin ParE1/3/4